MDDQGAVGRSGRPERGGAMNKKPRECTRTEQLENAARLRAFWEEWRRCHVHFQDHPGECGQERHADDRRMRLIEHRGAHIAQACRRRKWHDRRLLRYGPNPNTVHFTILMHSAISIRTCQRAPRGRSGKLLILRFTPRGLRRPRLETTRSCKISASTALGNAGFARGGNSAVGCYLTADNADGVEKGQSVRIFMSA